MTHHFYGSSLFQARKTDTNDQKNNNHHHHHRHSHLHGRSVNHLRSHAHFHRRQEENETADLDSSDPTITEVVQTISVVQVIDGSGAIIETQTFASGPQTNLLDAETGSTIDTNFKAVSLTSDSAAAATTSSTTTETPISSVDTVSDASETTPPSASPSDASLTATSLPPQETTDLTTPIVPTLSLPSSLSSSSAFPSLSSTFNSTISSFTSSSSSVLSSSSTRSNSTTTTGASVGSSSASQSLSSLVTTLSSSFSADSISGTTSSPLSSFTPSSNSATTSSPGAFSSSSGSDSLSASASPSSTLDIWGGGGSAGTTILSTPSSSSTSDSSGSSSDDGAPPTGTVVGGVVGGVAGLALLVAFAFMLLRFRKRGWCQLSLGDEKSITPATRAVDARPSGDGSGGGGGGGSGATRGTSQRSSVPYSVASSLAALAGKRSSRERSNTGSEMAERGFVRVSGKKLPPVLQYGGDGYSDPRDRSSLNSDATVYRDSMAIFNQSSSPQRLALGSPMRPESGVMVYNPGPAKTPVTGEVPKTIDSPTLPRNSTLPPADAIGRTLAAQDHSRDGAASRTSRGSARFIEQLS